MVGIRKLQPDLDATIKTRLVTVPWSAGLHTSKILEIAQPIESVKFATHCSLGAIG